MQELSTIQKRNKLNKVYKAYHNYEIRDFETDELIQVIHFQEGARKDKNSIRGAMFTDLLEIVRDCMSDFQKGEFPCIENDIALEHIEGALLWLNKRVEDRAERNVLGTYNK